MPHNPPQMRGDEKPCGELPGSSFSSTTQSGGTVPQDHFPPSSLISIDRRTFYLMPRTLQGTDASYCVYKITWWNLEIAPLGQSDPLLVPPIFWPLQFSVILCEEWGGRELRSCGSSSHYLSNKCLNLLCSLVAKFTKYIFHA